MGRIFPLLLAASLAGLGQRDEPTHAVRLLHDWMTYVQAHQPGEIDQPLVAVSDMAPGDLDIVRRTLGAAVKTLRNEERNDLLRRGALVHTDIALLLPERAAEYQQSPEVQHFYLDLAGKPHVVGREADTLVFTLDGEFVTTAVETAHWSMARMLLGAIEPRPQSDGFVPLWYRAVAAGFSKEGLFGNAKYQLDHALEVLPRDPVLLFYAGALHETFASARFQSVPLTRPSIAAQLNFPTAQEELRDAEKLLGASVRARGPIEARVRYARVLGQLGQHGKAAALLQGVAPQITDRRLQYFAALFLGSEEGALSHLDAARDAFERAAALYPTAQSPLLGLGDLFRRAGNRTGALEALGRLQALPGRPADRDDPWIDYCRSFAFDADQQLAAVRAWVNKEPR